MVRVSVDKPFESFFQLLIIHFISLIEFVMKICLHYIQF